jgi:hypothetical protein
MAACCTSSTLHGTAGVQPPLIKSCDVLHAGWSFGCLPINWSIDSHLTLAQLPHHSIKLERCPLLSSMLSTLRSTWSFVLYLNASFLPVSIIASRSDSSSFLTILNVQLSLTFPPVTIATYFASQQSSRPSHRLLIAELSYSTWKPFCSDSEDHA